MSMEKMREEFEAWWLSGVYPFRAMDRLEDAGVSEEAAQEIWQASRESLVIDFSQLNVQHASYNNVNCYAVSDVGVILKRSGLKVKL